MRWVAVAGRAGAVAGAVAVVGALPWLSGRDPALALLRARSAEQEPTPEALAAIRADLGLDAGPVALTWRWVAGLLDGDAGVSWVSGRPVLPGVLSGLGVSLTLMAAAMVVALAVAVALCAPTVLRAARGRPPRGAGTLGAVLAAMPEFLLGIGALIVVAVWLGWLPPFGWREPRHLVLPAVALGVPAGGLLGHLAADALRAALRERWVRAWRAAGFPARTLARAAVQRAMPALLPQTGLVVVGLTGGAVAVETIFAVPGLGRAALGAAESQDLPVLQACVLALVLLGIVVGIAADLVRRQVLGHALADAALAPPPPDTDAPRRRALPMVLGGVLLLLVGWGLTRDPVAVDTLARLAVPSRSVPLGADAVGRDVLARLGHGALATTGVAVLVTLSACLVGLSVGMLPTVLKGLARDAAGQGRSGVAAGTSGATAARMAGGVTNGLAETVNALPPVIIGLVVAAVQGPGVVGASLAVGLVAWAPLAVHAAALADEASAAPFLTAERGLGASERRILWRHVLPAVAGPVARHAALRLPAVALAIASLGFLGLGAQPPSSEWGLMLAEALPYVERAPWTALAPAGALALLAGLAVTLSGHLSTATRGYTRSGTTPSAVSRRGTARSDRAAATQAGGIAGST